MEPALADLFRRLKLASAERRLDALEQALGQHHQQATATPPPAGGAAERPSAPQCPALPLPPPPPELEPLDPNARELGRWWA